MGESGVVIILIFGCGEEEGVRGRADSATKVEVSAFENETREENDSRGEYGGVVVTKVEGVSGKCAINGCGQRPYI